MYCMGDVRFLDHILRRMMKGAIHVQPNWTDIMIIAVSHALVFSRPYNGRAVGAVVVGLSGRHMSRMYCS